MQVVNWGGLRRLARGLVRRGWNDPHGWLRSRQVHTARRLHRRHDVRQGPIQQRLQRRTRTCSRRWAAQRPDLRPGKDRLHCRRRRDRRPDARGNTNAWGAVRGHVRTLRPKALTTSSLPHTCGTSLAAPAAWRMSVPDWSPPTVRSTCGQRSLMRPSSSRTYERSTAPASQSTPAGLVRRPRLQRLHIGKADNGEKAMSLLSVQAGRSVHDVVGLYRDLVLEDLRRSRLPSPL